MGQLAQGTHAARKLRPGKYRPPPDEDAQSATPVDSDALLEQSPACDRVAIPAEVAGLPPGPVANQAKTVDS